MGNHYVPQELLRGFQSPSDPGTIWAYDKQLRRFAHIPIKLAAQETGYYDEQTEKDLSELLEGPAHSALARARAGEVIFGQDRTWWGLYAASMLWRGPRRRRKSFTIVPSVLASTVSELKAQILRLAEENKIDRAVLEERLAEFDRVHDKYTRETPQEVVDQIRSPWPGQRTVAFLLGMSWRIVMAPAGSSYLTGDAPASFLESLGLKNDEAEVVFPLASHVALHMCWQGPPGGTIRLPTSAAIV
jgi:hypothetical protein